MRDQGRPEGIDLDSLPRVWVLRGFDRAKTSFAAASLSLTLDWRRVLLCRIATNLSGIESYYVNQVEVDDQGVSHVLPTTVRLRKDQDTFCSDQLPFAALADPANSFCCKVKRGKNSETSLILSFHKGGQELLLSRIPLHDGQPIKEGDGYKQDQFCFVPKLDRHEKLGHGRKGTRAP